MHASRAAHNGKRTQQYIRPTRHGTADVSAVLFAAAALLVFAGSCFAVRAWRCARDTRFPSLETLVGGLFLVAVGVVLGVFAGLSVLNR
jgi:hypothetical protein